MRTRKVSKQDSRNNTDQKEQPEIPPGLLRTYKRASSTKIAVVSGIVAGLSVTAPQIIKAIKEGPHQPDPFKRAVFDCQPEKAASLAGETNRLLEPLTDSNHTPLHVAADDGCVELVQLLISEGASVSKRDDYDRTPLHHAADDADAETVQALLDAGAKLDVIDYKGRTPLFLAAASKSPAKVLSLVRDDPDLLNRRTHEGWTALHRAVVYADPETVKILLEHGADPNLPAPGGQHPLELAERGENPKPVVELLLAAGATRF